MFPCHLQVTATSLRIGHVVYVSHAVTSDPIGVFPDAYSGDKTSSGQFSWQSDRFAERKLVCAK